MITHRRTLLGRNSSLVFTLLIGLAPLLISAGCAKTVRSYTQLSDDSGHGVEQWSPAPVKSELLGRETDDLLAMGYNYLQQGNDPLAELHFAAALEKDPKAAAAYAGLGEVELRKDKMAKALNDFTMAITLEPKNRVALLGLGRLQRTAGELEQAAHYFEEANTAYPQECDIVLELAMTYDLKTAWRQAEALYRQAIALDGQRTESYNNLGYNLLLQGRYAEAIQAFGQALALDHDHKRARNNMAVAYILAGQEEKAMPYMEQTVGQAAAHNNLGYIYMSRGEWDKAEREFREAMALKPDYYTLANQNLEQLRQRREAREKPAQAASHP